ncbi:hypothetical protein AWC38_SpisGene397, partial [Stylophora pistillata]
MHLTELWRKWGHECQLLEANKYDSPEKMMVDETFVHFSIKPFANANFYSHPNFESETTGSNSPPHLVEGSHSLPRCTDDIQITSRVLPSIDGDWTAFWWYDVNITWPSNEIDVLAYEFGHCKPSDPYCFGRLPSDAKANETEMLAVDSEGTAYKWSFISNASAASAAWRAFHDHQEVDHGVSVGSILAWNPKVLNGSKPKNDQRAFMYRVQNGVKSVLLDDDNCDC